MIEEKIESSKKEMITFRIKILDIAKNIQFCLTHQRKSTTLIARFDQLVNKKG